MIKEKKKGFGKETFEEEILKEAEKEASGEKVQNESENAEQAGSENAGAEQAGSENAGAEQAESAGAKSESAEQQSESAGEANSVEADSTEAENKAAKENEDFKNQYVRLMADFQNFRKRTEKEKSDIYAYANEKIVVDLLSVIDNFERAIAMANVNEGADASFVEGMKMILKQMLDVLRKHDVKEIEAVGQDFDPNFHNAVMMEDNPDFESGKVTEVLQKGYMLNDRVIRPSMVKVAN